MGDSEATIPLLTPYKMGTFHLQHRMVLAPLTRCRAIDTVPQPAAAEYYSQRATSGGFMLTEGTCISQGAHGYPHTPGIYTKEQLEAWRPIVKAVKAKGATFFCQIWHVGRASHQCYQPNNDLPIGPSAIPVRDGEVVYTPSGPAEYPVPRALEKDEIPKVIEQYRIAARNAIDVGFDGVEIHGANGYLIDQFLKDGMNKRTDEYGGSAENRSRFCREVMDAVVGEIGAGRVGLRLSPFGGFLDASDGDPYATNLSVVEYANKLGLLYLHFIEPRVGGNNDREAPVNASIEPFRKAFKGTLVAAGGYKRDSGNEAIARGHADLICYGRLFLSNPDLPRRFALDAPLNKYNRSLFYTQGQKEGYTDYPFLDDVQAAA